MKGMSRASLADAQTPAWPVHVQTDKTPALVPLLNSLVDHGLQYTDKSGISSSTHQSPG